MSWGEAPSSWSNVDRLPGVRGLRLWGQTWFRRPGIWNGSGQKMTRNPWGILVKDNGLPDPADAPPGTSRARLSQMAQRKWGYRDKQQFNPGGRRSY